MNFLNANCLYAVDDARSINFARLGQWLGWHNLEQLQFVVPKGYDGAGSRFKVELGHTVIPVPRIRR